jgi:hypothetical protein
MSEDTMKLSEFFAEASRAAKMEETYPDACTLKYKSRCYKVKDFTSYVNWESCFHEIEFAMGILEGQPVFKDSELYLDGKKQVAGLTRFLICDGPSWSWNPPQPRAVMVELSVEDAKHIVTSRLTGLSECSEAFHKALGELK